MASAPTAVVLKVIRSAAQSGLSGVSDGDLLRRFAAGNDQAAFAALVRRHGGMVLGVCRRVLPNLQDAEDACQTTFLILARKAQSQNRWQASVANWLYATARKVAHNALLAARRRARREARAAVPEAVPALDEMTGRELLAALDEELDRLPPRYREPLVLCYLEGLTRDEAAVRLGVPAGTIKIQLERGRKRLGAALMRRGCALGAGLLTLAAISPAEASPPRVFEGILAAVAGAPRAAVASLAKGVAVQALLKKSILAALTILAISAFSLGAWSLMPVAATLVGVPPSGGSIEKSRLKAALQPQPAAERPAQSPVQFTGRVLDPEGKPLAGASLLLVGKGGRPVDLGTSAPDGRFTVEVPTDGTQCYFFAARAPGTGMDFVTIGGLDPARALELRLVKDHVIRGRIVDTQGKPVAGVRVGVTHIDAFDAQSVNAFLAAWTNRMISWQWPGGDKALWHDSGIIATTTDADGRFAVAGTGAERVVSLHVSGAGIADAEFRVVNRRGFNPTPYNETARKQSPIIVSGPDRTVPALYGPDPVFVVDPGKVIRGVVRDANTGKPWPGVGVFAQGISAKTDAMGRYEIRGVGKANSYALWVHTDLAAGVLGRRVLVPDTNGYAPVTADIAVTRVPQTVVVTGRIIDASTGKGVRGDVHLGILAGNPFARAHPELEYINSASSAEDGTYRIVTIPGPMLLMGGVDHEWTPTGQMVRSLRYKPATPDPKYLQYFPADHPGSYANASGGFALLQGNFCKVLQIGPGTAVVKQDITVEPASTITVKIQDALGRPLAGTFVGESGRVYAFGPPIRTETDSWVAQGVAESRQPRRLIFYEPSKKLFATLMLKGDEKGAVVARLQPCAAVRGRVVDKDGKPQSGVNVNLTYHDGAFWDMHAFIHGAKSVVTDDNGAFVIDEVIPGIEFQLWRRPPTKRDGYAQLVVGKLKAEPGRSTDLKDIRLLPSH
jgi:RNA polymerase sigma factor (sigma-70 family)